MIKYTSCPMCERKRKRGFFGGSHFPVYRCRKCAARFCNSDIRYGECPRCGHKYREQVGEVW